MREPDTFLTTRWTLVARTQGTTPEARAALSELCEAYWMPVFQFLRREGHDAEEAREMAQEFFAQILAGTGVAAANPRHGRFRSYLLGAVKHFLADRRDRDRCRKRGGGLAPASLDAPGPCGGSSAAGGGWDIPDEAGGVGDAHFDREWAVTVMRRALAALEAEHAGPRRAAQFRALKGWLSGGGDGGTQVEAGRKLGLSEAAVKVAVHRMRRRFRELVREELSQTLVPGSDVDDELRYLVEVLGRTG